MDLISVVVPVYNVELYIKRCVDSILSQSYRNIEVILVDDGSPDNCPSLCDNYSKQDKRVKVIHKKNGGLSDARNRGVVAATGQYITFIDSDDFVTQDYLLYLHNMITDTGADISCCCFEKTSDDTLIARNNDNLPEMQEMTGKEACKRLMASSLYLTLVTAWGKLYKAEIVKKYPFPVGRNHEDEATTAKYYYYANRVVVGNHITYAYYQNANGITHTNKGRKNIDVVWSIAHRADFFHNQNEIELEKMATSKLWDYLQYGSIENDGLYDKEIKEYFSKRYNRHMYFSTRIKKIMYLYMRWLFLITYKLYEYAITICKEW